MTEARHDRFQCEACGRQYPWKPQLAGRTARCRCGAVVHVPEQPPVEPEDLYDLAPEDPAATPARPAEVPPASVAQPAAGAQSARTGAVKPAPVRPLGYATPDTPAEQDQYIPDRQKDFQIPLVLLIAGIVIQFIFAWWYGARTAAGAIETLAAVGIDLVFGTIILLIGAFIAGRARGINFGPFWIAVLKLSAISVAPGALAMLLNVFLRFIPFGWLLTWVATFMFYFALIGALFDLDQSDTWYMVMVIFILRVAVVMAILAVGLSRI